LAGIEIEDFDLSGFLNDEEVIGIARRRGGEERLVEAGRDPGWRLWRWPDSAVRSGRTHR
jgi:hypothetical protein